MGGKPRVKPKSPEVGIKVTMEPGVDNEPLERCFSCFRQTAYWYTPKDVACCRTCARWLTPGEVPTKQQWIDKANRIVKGLRKPMEHWDKLASRHVVETIIRGAFHYTDERSVVGAMAQRRLLEIAEHEAPGDFVSTLVDRDRCIAGFSQLLDEIFGGEDE